LFPNGVGVGIDFPDLPFIARTRMFCGRSATCRWRRSYPDNLGVKAFAENLRTNDSLRNL
jgi:hypothetical protein